MASYVVDNSLQQGHAAEERQRSLLAAPILLQYLNIARRWRWVIVGLIVTSLLAGMLVTAVTPRKYTAQTRLEISRQQKNITKVDGVEGERTSQDLEFYQTQYSLLAARTLAERVARQLRLGSNAEFFDAHGRDMASETAPTGVGSGQTNSVKAREDATVELLLDNIEIKPIRSSALVDLAYTSQSPELSAKIANAWAQQFIAATLDRRMDSTLDARQYLERQLEELRQKLEQSERDAVNYASQRQIVTLEQTRDQDGKTQTTRTLASANLEALNAALAQATSDRIAAQSRAGTSGAVLSNVNSPLGALRQRRAELAAEYSQLMVKFNPSYPAAQAVQSQLRAIDSSIAAEENRLSRERAGEFAEAAKREQQLRAQVAGLTAQLDRQQRDTIQYNIYQREADTNRQLYDSLLQRYKEIGVAGVEASNVFIVDPAETPTSPSSPKLASNLIAALLVGIGLSIAACVALNQIDEGLRDPTRVQSELGVPLLGMVPDAFGKDVAAEVRDAKTELSEAYFSIYSNLSFSTDHGVPRTIMVTSTRPAEGKSTTSLALASALGRAGKRVVLVDCDLRSPSIHHFFDLQNVQGTSNLLAGAQDLDGLIRSTDLRGVDVITTGPTPPSAVELLSSDRLLEIVKALVARYDHVILDAAPVLGLADAPLLSRAVEGVVYVVESGGPAVRAVIGSLGRLTTAQAHILGVVLSKATLPSGGYGYGYGYSYGGTGDDGR